MPKSTAENAARAKTTTIRLTMRPTQPTMIPAWARPVPSRVGSASMFRTARLPKTIPSSGPMTGKAKSPAAAQTMEAMA